MSQNESLGRTVRDAASWDERYRTKREVSHREPNQFLAGQIEGLMPGRALDLACGEGRNAVWLATRGWNVTGVDFSTIGLEGAKNLAASSGVTVQWACADVTRWHSDTTFDLVLVAYLHLPEVERRMAFVNAARSVAPGGTLLIVGHDLDNLTNGVGGPRSPLVLYTADTVRTDLESADVPNLTVDAAERVERPVETDARTVNAVDCLVRAHRQR